MSVTAEEQAFWDELQIQKKLRAYFYSLDARDRAALETVFTDDVKVQYHTGTEGQFTQDGAKNIVDYLMGNMANYHCRTHVGANFYVALNGDRATSTTHAVATLWKGERMVVRGLRYDDRLVKENGDWRIQRREHVPLWQYETTPSKPDIPAPALALAKAQRAAQDADG